MHEIITLQLGQRSNYLATHFWNTQESYFTYSSDEESIVDHNIHFRPGIGADGSETFTPRTVIYDLKGGFGSLRKINALYEIEEPTAQQNLWSGGPTIIQRQAAILQNEYQQSLETGVEPPTLTTASVRYWSDFNRVFYHPKSIVQLNEYELSSALMPFEQWGMGEDLFHSLDKEHDILDRDLRPFAEEADQLQGIQMMTGINDAWGGFAARYMDRIRDEYGKTAVWVWGSEDNLKTVPREKRFLKLSNTARSLAEIAPQASIFVPMALPSTQLPSYINLDTHSEWHRSALFSTALESMSMSSRLRFHHSGRETLDQLANALNINGNQNIANLRISVDQKSAPHSTDRSGRLAVRAESRDARVPSQDRRVVADSTDEDDVGNDEDSFKAFNVDLFTMETREHTRGYGHPKKTHVFGLAENYRTDEDIKERQEHKGEDEGHIRARRRAQGLTIIRRTKIPLLFPVLDSFPNIFARTDTTSSLAVNTSLSTDTSVALRLKSIQQVVGRAVGIDEREALSNSLGELAEAYEEGWDSGSDDDDD